jgi:hypothetical protein
MIERIVSLGADYASTLGALARTEALDDVAGLRRALRARIAAALVLALGVAWLNLAVLLWLLTTSHALAGAGMIAALGIVIGLAMSASARRAAGSLRFMDGTRRVLAGEFGTLEPGVARGAQAAPIPMRPAEVGARLHAIREALRETVTLHRGPQGEPVEPPSGLRFEPRSRTLRGLMWLWRVIPRVPSGTALASALGMLAVNSPGLRRLLAAMALLRNLGGHPRPAARRPRSSHPS